MTKNSKNTATDTQLSQSRWHRIYASVVGVTVVVIFALYSFSQYYSG